MKLWTFHRSNFSLYDTQKKLIREKSLYWGCPATSNYSTVVPKLHKLIENDQVLWCNTTDGDHKYFPGVDETKWTLDVPCSQIMFYDEPTTGLDPESTTKVLELMDKLTQKRSIATIVVTHQFLDALEISDKFILIEQGRVAFDGNLSELRDSTEPRVLKFLEPFRESLRALDQKGFS